MYIYVVYIYVPIHIYLCIQTYINLTYLCVVPTSRLTATLRPASP